MMIRLIKKKKEAMRVKEKISRIESQHIVFKGPSETLCLILFSFMFLQIKQVDDSREKLEARSC